MAFLIALLLTLFTPSWAGLIHSVQIQELNLSQNDDALIMLSDGQVAWVESQDEALIETLRMAYRDQQWLHLDLDQDRYIKSVQGTEAPDDDANAALTIDENKSINFFPTTLNSLKEAQEIFQKMNPNYKDKSQCYNRAHVWAWEMYKATRLQSQKVFIFFPVKYIRQFKFEWWFHVTPMVNVMEKGKLVERTMDFRYAKGPLMMKNWTDIFMRNNAECPVITRYSQFEQDRHNPDGPWCMLLKSSMYYYQPLDLAALESKRRVKLFWMEGEILNAYREAFHPGQKP